MQFLGFTRELKPSNVVLDRIEHTDLSERLKHTLRLCALGVNKLPALMTPAQSMCDTDFLRVARISSVAIGQNN